MSTKSVLAISALALSLALAGSVSEALAQDTYSYDNFQNAPPGTFLTNKAKPQSTPAKAATKAPVKGKTAAKPIAKPVAPQTGVYNSGQMVPGNSFNYPAQNQLGQSDFIQPGGGQDQTGTSGWVTPDTLGNQVDNSYPQPQTQTPFDGDVELQQEFANQNNGGGGTSTSGWVNPGGNSGGGTSTSGWVNPGGNSGGGNFSQPASNQGGLSSSGWVNPGGNSGGGTSSSGWVNPGGNSGGGTSSSGWVNPGGNSGGGTMVSQPAPMQDNNLSSSGWITPGGGKGKGSSKPIKMSKPAPQMQPVPTQSQQWNQPQASNQAMPTQSQQWSQPQPGNQAPLFGQVLEQEQGNSNGNFQSNGATSGANTGNMSAANPPDMPAGGFTVSPDAAVMPGMMNMLMNMQKQNGGGGQRVAPQRTGFSAPPMVRGVGNQVGRTVNRAVNRSVNQMLYKGLNSLRF